MQPFPATGAKYQISGELSNAYGGGGRHPVWSRDGKKLLFAIVTTQPAFSVAKPEALTRNFEDSLADPVRTFDIAADGRILGVIGADQAQLGAGGSQIQMVLNWYEELKARAPTK